MEVQTSRSSKTSRVLRGKNCTFSVICGMGCDRKGERRALHERKGKGKEERKMAAIKVGYTHT